LKWAKQEKQRLEREQMFKEAGIDPSLIPIIKQEEEDKPSEIDLEAKLQGRSNRRNNGDKWIIYPEDPYKSGWDVFMTG
jgi:uncharacterized protein YjcR